MSDYSKLKVAELKDELNKKGVAYGKSDKKQTLIDLLDGAAATPTTVATAGFETATTTLPSTGEEADASAAAPVVSKEKSATTAPDALANGGQAAPAPPAASAAAPPADEKSAGGPSAEAPTPDVPASTLTASSSRSLEDRTETIVDEAPSGVEQSADGEDEKRGGNDVLGTDEEEIILGTLPPADTTSDVAIDSSDPKPVAAQDDSAVKGEGAAMNGAASSVPVATALAPDQAPIPTQPPPTPAGKRSLSPAAPDTDVEMVPTSDASAAKRAKREELTLFVPANFIAGSHPPTTALYITGLRRPLPDVALIDLLEDFGELDSNAGIGKGAGKPNATTEMEGWWLSPVKSHAFAAFTKPEAACRAYQSLLGRTDFPPEAPQPTPPLSVDFLPVAEIPQLIAQEEAAWSNGRKKLELQIALDGEQTWSYSYSGAGDVDLRRAGGLGPRAPFGGGGSAPPFGNFGGRGGFQNGGSRGGFGGVAPPAAPGSRGGFSGGRGGFMDRGLAPHLTGGYSSSRSASERPDLLAGDASFLSARGSGPSTASSATWGDRGRPAPFHGGRDDDDDDRWGSRPTVGPGRDPRDDRWGGRGRGGYGSAGGDFRPRDGYRTDNRRDAGRSSYRPDDRAAGSTWGASRGRDSRRSPSPPARRTRSPSPVGRHGSRGGRSRSPSRDRNGG